VGTASSRQAPRVDSVADANPRSVQRTYLLLTLLTTLATSFIWGINTLFLLDAGAIQAADRITLSRWFTKTAVLLGQAVGADGRALAADIQKQLDAVSVKTRSAAKPRVFHEVDASDLTKMYTVGPRSFIDDLITVAGGVNIAAGAKTQYPTISAEEVVKADPEVVILGDSAYGTTVDQVVARPGWSAMSAVKSKRVYPVPGNLFGRPGPRVGLAALEYAKLVHPELYR